MLMLVRDTRCIENLTKLPLVCSHKPHDGIGEPLTSSLVKQIETPIKPCWQILRKPIHMSVLPLLINALLMTNNWFIIPLNSTKCSFLNTQLLSLYIHTYNVTKAASESPLFFIKNIFTSFGWLVGWWFYFHSQHQKWDLVNDFSFSYFSPRFVFVLVYLNNTLNLPLL